MKLLLVVADANRLDALRADLHALGAPGYTVVPVAEGEGRTGLHAGDRIHPGALAAVIVIAQDDVAAKLFDELIRRRDAAGDTISRLFMLPVDRQG